MTILTKYVTADGAEIMLDGTQGIKVLRGLDTMDGSPSINSIDQRVGADGGVLLGRRRTERTFTLPLYINTAVTSASAVAEAFQGPGDLVSSAGRRLRSVIYESGLEAPYDGQMGGIGDVEAGWRKYNLHLAALDPWWYGSAAIEHFGFQPATGWDDPIPWDSPIPWNGGAAAQVDVRGHAQSMFPVWTITGPLTELTVASRNDHWTWTRELAAGEFGTVDHRPGSRSPRLGSALNGVAESPFGVWSLLSGDSTLTWGLCKGVNDLVVSISGEDAGSRLTLWYEPRWLGARGT